MGWVASALVAGLVLVPLAREYADFRRSWGLGRAAALGVTGLVVPAVALGVLAATPLAGRPWLQWGVTVAVALAAVRALQVHDDVDPPVDLVYACAQQGNDRLHSASSPSDCHPRREQVVTFSVDAPLTLCARDGTVRLGTCTGHGTTFTAPTTTPVYFCAETSNGNLLRRVVLNVCGGRNQNANCVGPTRRPTRVRRDAPNPQETGGVS